MLVFHRCQGDLFKRDAHALTVFGTRLKVLDFGMLCQELVDELFLDFPLRLTVDLVAYQNEWEFLGFLWGPLVHKLSDPGLNIIERLGQCREVPSY